MKLTQKTENLHTAKSNIRYNQNIYDITEFLTKDLFEDKTF